MQYFYFHLFYIEFRDDEFSPLKNGAGAAKDTAETSRNALYQQHRCDMCLKKLRNRIFCCDEPGLKVLSLKFGLG